MSIEQRLLADERAREAALDISRSFVVQAPAGSGKTELLIQRYLALLATVHNPEEVLATTFTRKAALEMSNRVVKALQSASDSALPDEEHRQITRNLAARVLQRDSSLGWRLSESPRRMRIQTLDSFCAGLTRSLPLSSGHGGALNTLTDSEIQSIYRQAAAATMDWLTAESDRAADVAMLLRHLDNNTGAYIEHLSRMLATRDQWLDLVGSGMALTSESSAAARRRLESNLSRYVSAQLEKLLQEFEAVDCCDLPRLLSYAAAQLRLAGPPGHALLSCDGLAELPTSALTDILKWQAISGLLLTQGGDWRKSVNKNDGFPPNDHGEKKQLLELFAKLGAKESLRCKLHRARQLPDPQYEDRQWQVMLALFRMLPLAVAELRRLFAERGATDHTEVALAAGTALGDSEQPGDIALRLDYAIRHILVDEMQDTSVGQYRLIEKLISGWTPDDGKTLFCVGDPMQSIYRFRDAEVGRFLQLRRTGVGSVKLESLVLRRNFRSGENLVHWFNTVFSQLFPLQDDIADGAIGYVDSVYGGDKPSLGECRVYPMFGASISEEGSQIVKIVRRLVQTDYTDPQTKALLVRSRTQLPSLLRQLRDAGIEYRAVEIDRLGDLPEIVDLVALTRALCHEGDRLAWLALLRAPWVGLGWSDLHKLVLNDISSTVRQLLDDPARMSRLSPDARLRVCSFLNTLGEVAQQRSTQSLRERVEVTWFALGGPALLTDSAQLENAYRYLDLVESLESAGTLADVRELDSKLDDVRVSSVVANPAALQVMTMHKAKGLEFDHVILYALGRSTRGRTGSILSWMNIAAEDGGFEMLLSPIGRRSELEKDRLHRCIEAAESDKQTLELDRLLYVACTRARRSLHLVGNVALRADAEEFARPVGGSLLARLWPALESQFERAFRAGQGIFSGDEDTGARLLSPILRRFTRPFELPPAPSLPVNRASPERVAIQSDVEYHWVGMAARFAGTIVHALLKRMADGQLALDADSIDTLRTAVVRMAAEMGVAGEAIDDVVSRVGNAMKGILQDARGKWLVTGEGHAELPLTGQWRDGISSIVIDRVRIDNGVHWIVDYKTSSHEGGDLEGFLDQEAERYLPQLQKYADLYRRTVDADVRAALYFPLLQRFREVSVDRFVRD
jgi:ATP-dependent exoDNAse (exonuclease V) beta subunit